VSRFPQGSPERGEVAQVLGLSHYLAGHIAEAIPYLEQVRAATGDSKVTYALAMAYAQTRQPDQAREAIARTFQLPPAAAAAYLLTGQMMNRLELEDQAQAALGQALAKDPKLPEVHYLLGQIAVFRSRYDEGLSLMRAELAISSMTRCRPALRITRGQRTLRRAIARAHRLRGARLRQDVFTRRKPT
jgi:tetratricopeptide (TPR) repeat protein